MVGLILSWIAPLLETMNHLQTCASKQRMSAGGQHILGCNVNMSDRREISAAGCLGSQSAYRSSAPASPLHPIRVQGNFSCPDRNHSRGLRKHFLNHVKFHEQDLSILLSFKMVNLRQ